MMRSLGVSGRVVQAMVVALAVATTSAGVQAQSTSAAGKQRAGSSQALERGRYLVMIGGCNDCHTPGFAVSGGKLPEKDWLVGDSVGFSGPWGITYASNLRLLVSNMTQQDWIKRAHSEMRPPMPAPSLHHMHEDDLKAVYRFIASLGPAGKPAPQYLPPGSKPTGPVVVFPTP